MTAPPLSRPALVADLRLVRPVGGGGEGEVWEARDRAGRRRALKLVRPDALAADASRRIAYLRRIDHPALVRVTAGGRLDAGPLAGWGYLEMDYVDGPSLAQAPADPQVLPRLAPLAEALDLLHVGAWSDGLALVHRDVKPANIVGAADGRYVLVDPSTLRGVDATQVTRVSTPLFGAPEVDSGRIGPPADVYSFAVTVVALLTGARGAELADLLNDLPALDLPDGVRLALSPRPGDRPVSCRSVLEAGTRLADDPTLLLPLRAATRSDGDWPAREDFPPPTVELPWDPASALMDLPWDTTGTQAQAPPEVPDAVTPEDTPAGSPWPWAATLVALVGLPTAAAVTGRITAEDLPRLLLIVAGAHLLLTAAARQPKTLALLAPPVAWAFLLARRVRGGRRRRAWARAVLTAATGVLAAAGVAALPVSGLDVDRLTAAAAVTGGLVLVLTALAAASAGGVGGILLRVILLPLWLAGAAVVASGALLLAPVAHTGGLAAVTVASLLETVRGPRQ